jgi:hypothetical protein
MPSRTTYFLLSWLVGATVCAAATPEQRMDEIYGGRLRAARTAPMKAELAGEMLKDASKLDADPEVQLLLYRKSYDLAVVDPSGFPTAQRAMALLVKTNPNLKGEAEEKLIELAEREFRLAPPLTREAKAAAYADRLIEAGDNHVADHDFNQALILYQRAADVPGIPRSVQGEAALKLKAIRFEQSSEDRGKELQTRLKKNPSDSNVASTLVRVLILDLDRPAEAKQYVEAARDAKLARVAGNAALDPESLAESDALELADWYRTQAATSNDGSRPIALRRSARYLQRFLDLHKEHDLPWLKESRAADEVAKSLALAAPTFQRRINLLPVIGPQHDGLAGAWKLTPAGLSCDSAPYARLTLHYYPPAEYDFHIEFTASGGYGIDTMILTDADHTFQWTMDRSKCYIERINPKSDDGDAKGAGRSIMSLQDGHRYSAVVQVRKGSITAFVDGKRMATYQTDFSDLEPVQGFDIGKGVLGLGAYQTPTTFHVVEIIEVTGTGKFD